LICKFFLSSITPRIRCRRTWIAKF
jgi:hypothetical protein